MKKLLWVLLILLISSCSKKELLDKSSDHPIVSLNENKFFQIPSNANPLIIKIINEIQNRNSRIHFVDNFSKTSGFPVWEKSLISAVPGKDTLVYIPTVLAKSNQTNGFIKVVINNGITISSFKATDYENYPFDETSTETTAQQFTSLFMYFDSKIFGSTSFILNDNRLYSNSKDNSSPKHRFVKKIENNLSSFGDCTTVTEYTEWLVQDVEHCTCTNKANCDWQTGCTDCSNKYSVTFTYGVGNCSGGGRNNPPIPIGGTTWDPGPPGGSGSSSTPLTQIAWFPVPEEYIEVANELNTILMPFDYYSFKENNDPNPPSFIDVNQLQSYLNSNTLTYDYSLPPIIVDQNEITQRARINFGLGGGVDIHIKLIKNSGVWTVDQVTSADWGITFAWDWTHTTSIVNTNGYEITVDVIGYINYNLLYKDIGTVYKQFNRFQVKLNNQTGEITLIQKK